MIRKIFFSNFYSFKEENTIDFTINSRTPKSPSFFKTCDNLRLSKIYTVIGANASGKTNFLRLIAFIGWFAKYSYTKQTENSDIPYKSFVLNFHDQKNPVGKISVEIEENKSIYRYEFSFNKKNVTSESLKQIFPTEELIFSMHRYDKQTKYNLKNLDVSKDFIELIKPNASILSLAIDTKKPKVKNLSSAFNAYTNVREIGYVDPNYRLNNTLKNLEKNPHHKKEVLVMLKNFDFNISDLLINSNSQGEYTNNSFGIHKITNKSGATKDIAIPFIYESAGTKYLISILDNILSSLNTGVTAIIDEIDNNLHPLIIPEIVNLYINPETNPKNAQLIISTHNTELLNFLNKSEILISEKSTEGVSQIYKLSQIKGILESDNLLKKYLSGTYGGIPNV